MRRRHNDGITSRVAAFDAAWCCSATPAESGGSHVAAQAGCDQPARCERALRREARAADAVSLDIHPARWLAWWDRRAPAKTTLVNLLPRFVTPGGVVFAFDGDASAGLDTDCLRAQFAMVSQDIGDVQRQHRRQRGARRPVDEQRVRQCWRRRSPAREAALPRACTRWWGTTTQLSGGQRQLAIARKRYKTRPVLMILDEATSALDTSRRAYRAGRHCNA